MNIHQGEFLTALGVREKDLANLPEEIQREFDRLADMREPRKLDHAEALLGACGGVSP